MKKRNTITLEELKENKEKKEVSYSVITFLKKEILPVTLVCMVICCLVVLAGTVSMVSSLKSGDSDCTVMYCGDTVSISSNYFTRLKMLALIVISSIVPYFYMPYLGLIGYAYMELITLSQAIVAYGYFAGILRYLVMYLINISIVSVITSCSIYIAKIVTAKFITKRSETMNFTNFRLKFYEMIKNDKKYNEVLKKKQKKISKLEKRVKKIDWKNLSYIAIAICIIQFISVVIEKLLV